MRLIRIEFTEDTATRDEGDVIDVDPASAKSLCDRKKVAKRVGVSKDADRSAERVPTSGAAPLDATGDDPVEPATDAASSPGADD